MTERNIVAIDLGASSGRVMLATWHAASRRLALNEIHRFTNQLTTKDGHDTWDLARLEHEILVGLHLLDSNDIRIDSIGIDTWGVDYVLLDRAGKVVGLPYAYRDSRTEGVMAQTIAELGREKIYRHTGIQFLPFNTLYQLKALRQQQPERLLDAAHLLLIPDYFHYRLTGQLNCEYTNASTTQLLNLDSGSWDQQLLDYLDIPRHWLSDITMPGNTIGYWQSPTEQRIPVIAVATHDTASAVIAAPLLEADCAYLSSGTWSLMGIESPHPYNDASALAANITNEGGINGNYRVLKNIMGLWLLQRICQELAISDLPALVASASALPAFVSLIDPNHQRFINPPSMVTEIQRACRQHQQPIPATPAQLARCIFDSLAMLYRQVVMELGQLRGAPIRHLHIVGGGSQNQFLNQLCADVCQLTVSAGPVEASTLGNIGCQLIALGDIADVNTFRQHVAQCFPLQHYTPHQSANFADAHQRRFQAISTQHEELFV